MSPNRTSVWKLTTLRISRELPLFNFERLDILCTLIGHPGKSYDHLNFSRASNDQFLASRYIMRLNQTPEWKVLTSWISREPPLYNFDRLDILCPRIRHPCENLWPHEFSRASGDQFWASRYIIRQNRISEWKVMTIRILESMRCSISSVSIYYAP